MHFRGTTEEREHIQSLIDVINSVHPFKHNDLTVRMTDEDPKIYSGCYVYSTIRPTILLSRQSENVALSFFHEVGHYIEERFSPLEKIGEQYFSITNNDSFNRLIRLARYVYESKYYHYLLSPCEVWARAYAQYVVYRSNNSEWRQLINDDHLQWNENDFGGFSHIIERVCRRIS